MFDFFHFYESRAWTSRESCPWDIMCITKHFTISNHQNETWCLAWLKESRNCLGFLNFEKSFICAFQPSSHSSSPGENAQVQLSLNGVQWTKSTKPQQTLYPTSRWRRGRACLSSSAGAKETWKPSNTSHSDALFSERPACRCRKTKMTDWQC